MKVSTSLPFLPFGRIQYDSQNAQLYLTYLNISKTKKTKSLGERLCDNCNNYNN